MRFVACAVSPPLSVRISPVERVVLLGYHRPFAMFGPVVHELDAKSKMVVARIPLLLIPLWRPAVNKRPSARNDSPLQKTSTGSEIDTNVPVEVPLAGGVQMAGRRLFVPHVSTRPSGSRLALIAMFGHVIGAAHWPALAIGEVRSKLTTTFCDADMLKAQLPDDVPAPVPTASHPPPAHAFR